MRRRASVRALGISWTSGRASEGRIVISANGWQAVLYLHVGLLALADLIAVRIAESVFRHGINHWSSSYAERKKGRYSSTAMCVSNGTGRYRSRIELMQSQECIQPEKLTVSSENVIYLVVLVHFVHCILNLCKSSESVRYCERSGGSTFFGEL